MSKESQILIRSILLDVRVCRTKQGNKNIDENDGSKEIPRVVNDQSEWITESIIGRIKVG
jgi:hypothetical protein